MLKRRGRESNKTSSAQFKELSESDSKLSDQLASLERSLKGHERDLRALEKNVVKRLASIGAASPAAVSIEPLPPTEPIPFDSNQHLHGVLAQLERIANASPQKLPRPMGADFSSAEDPTLNPALAGLASLASARTQGVYGLSPRVPLPSMKPAPSGTVGAGSGRRK